MQLSPEPEVGRVLRLGYGLFLFFLTARLAVFALPWFVTVRFASAALAMLLAMPLVDHGAFALELWNDLWPCSLMLAATASATHSAPQRSRRHPECALRAAARDAKEGPDFRALTLGGSLEAVGEDQR